MNKEKQNIKGESECHLFSVCLSLMFNSSLSDRFFFFDNHFCHFQNRERRKTWIWLIRSQTWLLRRPTRAHCWQRRNSRELKTSCGAIQLAARICIHTKRTIQQHIYIQQTKQKNRSVPVFIRTTTHTHNWIITAPTTETRGLPHLYILTICYTHIATYFYTYTNRRIRDIMSFPYFSHTSTVSIPNGSLISRTRSFSNPLHT